MKWRSIASVISKSAMTPSFMGRMATIFPGVRPNIRLASSPTAKTLVVPAWIATTEGSRRTIPRSRTYTSELAVPRSIPMSLENRLLNCANMNDAQHGVTLGVRKDRGQAFNGQAALSQQWLAIGLTIIARRGDASKLWTRIGTMNHGGSWTPMRLVTGNW